MTIHDTPRRAPRVKICCMGSIDEARVAVAFGAHAVGLVSAMPSGPGPISEARIAEIVRTLPPMVGCFLLTSAQDPRTIVAQQRRCGTNTLQIVDRLALDAYPVLRRELPGIAIVQVIHVRDGGAVDEARGVAPFVDAILLDSGNPSLAIKELGGTGRTHDWSISRRLRDAVPVPVILAGGLNATNVAEAIAAVDPFAVDICSGVRTDGKLDRAKLAAFMKAAGH